MTTILSYILHSLSFFLYVSLVVRTAALRTLLTIFFSKIGNVQLCHIDVYLCLANLIAQRSA